MLKNWLMENQINAAELIDFANSAKDPAKATCIEAIEFASLTRPEIINDQDFQFMIDSLGSKAPRVKWESAKVIGNTAHLFKDLLEPAINNLIENTAHKGTVVRWSAAFALGEILKLKTDHNQTLLPAVGSILEKEEKNSIKKKYQDAIRKMEKK